MYYHQKEECPVQRLFLDVLFKSENCINIHHHNFASELQQQKNNHTALNNCITF